MWNALEKLGVAEPEVFVDYYASDTIALAAQAWLGPAYQITSQLNVVQPGGAAQTPHRDYHLGFLSEDEAEQFPAHSHLMSAMLTLQGAVAHLHVAMPVEAGARRGEHLGRAIDGDDTRRIRRERLADLPGAAAQIADDERRVDE